MRELVESFSATEAQVSPLNHTHEIKNGADTTVSPIFVQP